MTEAIGWAEGIKPAALWFLHGHVSASGDELKDNENENPAAAATKPQSSSPKWNECYRQTDGRLLKKINFCKKFIPTNTKRPI